MKTAQIAFIALFAAEILASAWPEGGSATSRISSFTRDSSSLPPIGGCFFLLSLGEEKCDSGETNVPTLTSRAQADVLGYVRLESSQAAVTARSGAATDGLAGAEGSRRRLPLPLPLDRQPPHEGVLPPQMRIQCLQEGGGAGVGAEHSRGDKC